MAYEGYARVELMGYRVRYGRVSEEEAYGAKMLRLDIPFESGEVTEYYGGSSVYALTPISEEMCRDELGKKDPRPVRPLQYRLTDDHAETTADAGTSPMFEDDPDDLDV
jgi:hypothetical protein